MSNLILKALVIVVSDIAGRPTV